MIETAPDIEKVIIVGLVNRHQDARQAKEYLDELEFLALTAGASVLKKFTQRLEMPNPATFVGSGKLEEINNYIKVQEVDTVIFDDELSPTQLRNLEKELECKVLDRTNLIL
ncbi:Ribosome LSU-associated GTP-binding protein HflX, partial [hydrothermal vent metagenome]